MIYFIQAASVPSTHFFDRGMGQIARELRLTSEEIRLAAQRACQDAAKLCQTAQELRRARARSLKE